MVLKLILCLVICYQSYRSCEDSAAGSPQQRAERYCQGGEAGGRAERVHQRIHNNSLKVDIVQSMCRNWFLTESQLPSAVTSLLLRFLPREGKTMICGCFLLEELLGFAHG